MTTKSRADLAMELLATGHSCSEALMLSYAKASGLSPALALKLASGFAGGMGEGRGICGVVTAGCMVLGLAAGPEDVTDPASRDDVRRLVDVFREGFLADHGSLVCEELNGGFDPATPQGKEGIRASGRAPVLVACAVERIDALLCRAVVRTEAICAER